MIYESINQPVLLKIPQGTKRLLDIGCGSGALGKIVGQEIGCEVVGVTFSEAEAALASKNLDQVVVQDLNYFDPSSLGMFDCVICSHILEHLYQPQHLLDQVHKILLSEATVIVALPNVLFWKQRLQFLRGSFKYTEGGLMDQTHFRFFDWETAHQLIQESGYQVLEAQADGSFPLPLIRKILPSLGAWVDSAAVIQFPGLFGFQFVFSCSSSLK